MIFFLIYYYYYFFAYKRHDFFLLKIFYRCLASVALDFENSIYILYLVQISYIL